MIFGIGTDIVSIERMRGALERFGQRFAERVLSESELEGYVRTVAPANYLAKRFAAKEAAVKALGTGFREGMSLRHISVEHNELGRPELRFSGAVAAQLEQLGVTEVFVSLADEREHAIAFVTMTCEGRDS